MKVITSRRAGIACALCMTGITTGITACGPAVDQRAAYARTDSAGVQIAASNAAAWDSEPARRWTIIAEPVLDLSQTGSGPSHEFYRVVGGTVLSDGRIIVADDGSTQIRSFSASGSPEHSVGEEGEGPEQYRQLSKLIRLPGDSLAVFSWPTKLTILAPDLAFVRTHRVGDTTWDPELLLPNHLAAMEIYPSVVSYDYSRGSRLIRPEEAIVRVSMLGEVEGTVWRGPGAEQFMFVSEERRGSALPLFGKRPAYATRDSLVVVGASDEMEYRVLDRYGRLKEIVRVPTYDLTLRDSLIDLEVAARLGTEPTPAHRRMIEQMPVPDRLPAYSDLIVDSEGCVWAREPLMWFARQHPTDWEIFSPSGEWLGSIQTPGRFRVLEIGPDFLLGVRTDELDVESVQLLRLERGGVVDP